MATRFNKEGWYDLFYSPFSDAAHVNAAAVDREISAISHGEIHLGGRFEDPWLVVTAACEAVSHVAQSLDIFYKLDNRTARDAVDAAMMQSLGSHAAALKSAED